MKYKEIILLEYFMQAHKLLQPGNTENLLLNFSCNHVPSREPQSSGTCPRKENPSHVHLVRPMETTSKPTEEILAIIGSYHTSASTRASSHF